MLRLNRILSALFLPESTTGSHKVVAAEPCEVKELSMEVV